MFHLTHNSSFWRRVFPDNQGNQQMKTKKQNCTCTQNNKKKQTHKTCPS